MRLPCGRLGTDITDGATNILALFGAVLEVSIGGDVLRNAHAGGRDVVDHPVHDRIMAIDPCILRKNCIGLRSGGTFGPRQAGGHVVAVLGELVVQLAT